MSTVPIIKIISLTIVWSAVASTVIAFIYGLLSWCLIKKFRNFRNYLLLSAISASLLKLLTLQIQLHANDLVKHIQDSIDFDLVYAILLFFSLSFHCWLIVLAYMFYADYTKVFDLDIKKKYLKTILFCWCIPILETVLFFLGMTFLSRDLFLYVTMLILMLIPLLISLIIYVVVVYLVFRGGKSEMWSSTKKWGRFGISTLIFVTGNWFVITNLFKLTRANHVVFYFVGEMEEYLLHVLISIFIIFVKSNRRMWGEFMNKKQEQNSLDMN